MKRIKKVSEAFSIQPIERHVSTEWELSQNIPHVKSIELFHFQPFQIEGQGVAVYIGYDFEGNELFQFIARACNVEYFDE